MALLTVGNRRVDLVFYSYYFQGCPSGQLIFYLTEGMGVYRMTALQHNGVINYCFISNKRGRLGGWPFAFGAGVG